MNGEFRVFGCGVVIVEVPAIEDFVRLGAEDVVELVAVDCDT